MVVLGLPLVEGVDDDSTDEDGSETEGVPVPSSSLGDSSELAGVEEVSSDVTSSDGVSSDEAESDDVFEDVESCEFELPFAEGEPDELLFAEELLCGLLPDEVFELDGVFTDELLSIESPSVLFSSDEADSLSPDALGSDDSAPAVSEEVGSLPSKTSLLGLFASKNMKRASKNTVRAKSKITKK